MRTEWLTRLVQVTVITLAMAAILQELEKPRDERKWRGMVAKYIPYDFQLPTIKRLKETYWNPYDAHLFTQAAFGVGWAINVYALLERLSLIRQASVSEEDFLMPTKAMKDLLVPQTASD